MEGYYKYIFKMPQQINSNQPINYTPVQPGVVQTNTDRKPLVIILIIGGIVLALCACCIGIFIFLSANSKTTYTSSCIAGTCTVKVCNKIGDCLTDKCYTNDCESDLRNRLEGELR